MDESTIKGLELLELTSSDANIQKIWRIVVEGYDTSLPKEDVDATLREHFASCGKMIHVYIPRDVACGILIRFALIYLGGEGEEEKALSFNGSDMGGQIVSTKSYPFHEKHLDLDLELTPMRTADWLQQTIAITGYDPSLPRADVESALRKHLSSCGKVRSLVPQDPSGGFRRHALVFVDGEEATEKVVELSGRYVGGWKFVVSWVAPIKRGRKMLGYIPHRNKAMMTEEQKAKDIYFF